MKEMNDKMKECVKKWLEQLDEEERVREIAHMLSGEVLSDAAIENARALIKLK